MKSKMIYYILVMIFITLIIFLYFLSKKKFNNRILNKKNIIIINNSNNKISFINKKIVENIINSVDKNISMKKLLNINLELLENKLNKNNFIKKADVFIDINSNLNIIIKQNIPILRIKNKNKNYYLTDDAKVIPLNNTFSAKVILAEGDFKNYDNLPVIKLVKYIYNDNLLNNLIIGIKKVKFNSFNLVSRINKNIIMLGSLMNFKKKLFKLKVFYKQYLNKIKIENYKFINLKYKNQVIATK